MLKGMTTESEILRLIGQHGVLKDSEFARLLGVTHQQVNQAARGLAVAGVIACVPGPDGVIRNRQETPGEPLPPLHEPSHRAVTTPFPKPSPVRRRVAAGAPVTRQDLSELGFEEHYLQRVPSADVTEAGLLGWNTLGHVPDAPGLYCSWGNRTFGATCASSASG